MPYPDVIDILNATTNQLEYWFLYLPPFTLNSTKEYKWTLISNLYYLGNDTCN